MGTCHKGNTTKKKVFKCPIEKNLPSGLEIPELRPQWWGLLQEQPMPQWKLGHCQPQQHCGQNPTPDPTHLYQDGLAFCSHSKKTLNSSLQWQPPTHQYLTCQQPTHQHQTPTRLSQPVLQLGPMAGMRGVQIQWGLLDRNLRDLKR